MSQNTKKLIVLLVLCMCGIGLSIGLVLWIFSNKNGGGIVKKKYVSWAEMVNIDPQKLYPVTDVVDGDTIKTSIEGRSITIRLLGINTPEVVDPRKSVECYGPEASVETKSLLTGKSVFISLNKNYEKVDKYGRLLAYIRLNDADNNLASDQKSISTSTLFINEFLIKEGFAYEYTFNEKNPYQYQKLFKDDELKAKKAKKGLWGKCDKEMINTQ